MASSFDINAAIQLQAPTNIDSIASSIQSKLTGIKANIDVGIPPGASAKITNLNNRLKTLIQNLKDVAQNATSAASAIQAIGASLDGTSTRLSNLQSYLKAVSAGFVNIGRSVLPASDTIEKFGQQSALAARRFSAFTVAAGAIVGVVAGIKTGLSEAINFQQQIVKIGQITQQSTNNLKPLVDEVTRLGVTFGVSSKSLIEISNTLAQAGLSAKDTRAALEALAKTTLAPTFGDIKNTTEAAISAMSQFSIAASDFEKVFGSLNSVAAAFAVEGQDLTTVITKAGGVFKTLSGDIDSPITQLNQLISLFTSVRQTTRESADTIATGFRTIFGRLERPQTLQFLEAMGVKLTDLKGNFIGVFPAVRELNKALSEIPSTSPEYAKIVEQIGGLRQISKVIPLIQQFPVALRALQVAQAGQNSLTVDASRSQEAFAQRLSKVKEEFLDLFRIISQNQVFTALADGFLRTATAIAQITKALEPLIPLMTAYAAIKFVPAAAQFGKGFFNYFTTQGVAHRAQGGEIPHFSRGGYVPGHGTGDTVPAMLEPKEFVIKQSSTARVAKNHPGVLEYINKYGVLPQRRTTGDEITKYLQKLQDSTRQSSGTEIEYKPNELRDLKLLRSLKSRLSPVYKPRKTDPKISFEDSLEYFNDTGAAKHLLEALDADPKLFHKVQNIIPREARLIGTGRIAAAFGVPNSNEVFRVGADVGGKSSGKFSRTNSPLVVQPNKTNRLGPVIVERLPFAQSLHDLGFSRADIYDDDEYAVGSRVTGSLLEKFYQRTKKAGLKAHDIHSGNIGFLGKRLMAIDPDAVKFAHGDIPPTSRSNLIRISDLNPLPINYLEKPGSPLPILSPDRVAGRVARTINNLPDFIDRNRLLSSVSSISLHNTFGPIEKRKKGYFTPTTGSINSNLTYDTIAHELTHAYDYSKFFQRFRTSFESDNLRQIVRKLAKIDPRLTEKYPDDPDYEKYLKEPKEILARGVGNYTEARLLGGNSYAEEVFGRIRKQRFAHGDSVDNLSIRQRFQNKLRNQRDEKIFGSEIDFGDLLNDFPEDFGNTKQTDKPGLLNKVKKLNKLADGDLIKELEKRIIRLPFEQNFQDSDLITKRGTSKIFSRIIENASNSSIASIDKILGSFDKLIVGQDDKNFVGRSVAPFGVKGASHNKAFYEYGKKFGRTLFPGNIYTTDNPFDFSGILAKALDYSEGSLLGGTFASKIKDSKFNNIVRVAKNRPGRYKGTKSLVKDLLKDSETKGLSKQDEDFLASLQGDLKYLSNPKNMFKEYFLDKTLDFNNNTLRRMSSRYNLGGPVRGYGEGDTVPALLTPQEFVVKKDSAQSVGYSNLRYINEHGELPGYNKGGIVGMAGGGLLNKEQEFGTVYSKLSLTGRDQLEAELYRANTRLLESLGEEYDNSKKASLAHKAFTNALTTGDKVITNFAGKIVGLGSIDELVQTRKEVKRTGVEELDTVLNPSLFSKITGKKIGKGTVAAGAVGLSLFGPELLRASLGEDKAKDITAGGGGAFAGLYTGGSIGASIGGVQGALVGAILGAITLGLTSYLTSSKNSVAEKQQKDIAEKQATFNEILSTNINKFGLDTKSRSAIVGTQGIISDVEKQAKAKAEEGSFFGLLPFNFSDIGATQNEIERRKKNITLGTLRENTLSGYAPALQNLEKLAQETRVKTGGTAEQRATEFETKLRATGGGAGEQLLTLVASFKSIAEGTLDRKAAEQELLKTLKEEAELRNKNLTLIKTSEDLADKFKDMYNNIGEFTTRLQVVNSKIEDLGGSLGDVLSGQNIKLKDITQNLLTQPSRFTPDANSPFKESLDRLLEPLGAAGQELGSFILEERRAIAELDPILKSVARTSTARTIESDIRGGLKQVGVSGITADSVIANLEAMGGADEGLDKVLINLQTDTVDTINKIKKDLLDFSTPLGQAGQQLDKLNTQIYESATKISAYNDKVREETVRISEITLQQQEVGARRQAERFGGSPLNYISLQAEQEPFRQRVRSLAGTENPQQIGQNIISLSAQLKQLRDNASNLKDETAKLKFADLQTQIRNSEQALRLLANTSERSAKIEERLSLLKQQEEGRFDFFKRLVTAKPEELPQLNKEITSANALVQHFNRGGSLDQLPASLRVEGASALAGPFSRFAFRSANNLTGEDILKQFQQRGLPSIGLPAGLLSYNLKERNEKGGLESEQNRVFESAKEAQQQIANIYQNAAQQQQEIFGQSVNIFKDSVAEFSKLFKADADKYKNQPLIEKRTVLTNALGRAPTAEDSELLNSFKRNKERIQEAVSAKGTLESLNKIKDIRSELPNILGKTGEDFDKVALNSSVGTRVAKLTNSSILPTELSEIFENVKKKRLEEIKAQSPLPFTFGLVGGSLDKKNQLQKDFDKNVQDDFFKILQDRLNKLKTDKTSEIDNARTTSGLGSQFDVFIDKFDQFGKVLENVDLNKFNDLISSLKSVPVAETKANGGSIFRPRGTDVVPAMLSPDEYIVNSRSSIANRPLLDRINSAKGPVYLAGGGEGSGKKRRRKRELSQEELDDLVKDNAKLKRSEELETRQIIKNFSTDYIKYKEGREGTIIPSNVRNISKYEYALNVLSRGGGDVRTGPFKELNKNQPTEQFKQNTGNLLDQLSESGLIKTRASELREITKQLDREKYINEIRKLSTQYKDNPTALKFAISELVTGQRGAAISKESRPELRAIQELEAKLIESELRDPTSKYYENDEPVTKTVKSRKQKAFTGFDLPFRKNSKAYKEYVARQRSIPDYGAYGGPRLPTISSAATGLYQIDPYQQAQEQLRSREIIRSPRTAARKRSNAILLEPPKPSTLILPQRTAFPGSSFVDIGDVGVRKPIVSTNPFDIQSPSVQTLRERFGQFRGTIPKPVFQNINVFEQGGEKGNLTLAERADLKRLERAFKVTGITSEELAKSYSKIDLVRTNKGINPDKFNVRSRLDEFGHRIGARGSFTSDTKAVLSITNPEILAHELIHAVDFGRSTTEKKYSSLESGTEFNKLSQQLPKNYDQLRLKITPSNIKTFDLDSNYEILARGLSKQIAERFNKERTDQIRLGDGAKQEVNRKLLEQQLATANRITGKEGNFEKIGFDRRIQRIKNNVVTQGSLFDFLEEPEFQGPERPGIRSRKPLTQFLDFNGKPPYRPEYIEAQTARPQTNFDLAAQARLQRQFDQGQYPFELPANRGAKSTDRPYEFKAGETKNYLNTNLGKEGLYPIKPRGFFGRHLDTFTGTIQQLIRNTLGDISITKEESAAIKKVFTPYDLPPPPDNFNIKRLGSYGNISPSRVANTSLSAFGAVQQFENAYEEYKRGNKSGALSSAAFGTLDTVNTGTALANKTVPFLTGLNRTLGPVGAVLGVYSAYQNATANKADINDLQNRFTGNDLQNGFTGFSNLPKLNTSIDRDANVTSALDIATAGANFVPIAGQAASVGLGVASQTIKLDAEQRFQDAQSNYLDRIRTQSTLGQSYGGKTIPEYIEQVEQEQAQADKIEIQKAVLRSGGNLGIGGLYEQRLKQSNQFAIPFKIPTIAEDRQYRAEQAAKDLAKFQEKLAAQHAQFEAQRQARILPDSELISTRPERTPAQDYLEQGRVQIANTRKLLEETNDQTTRDYVNRTYYKNTEYGKILNQQQAEKNAKYEEELRKAQYQREASRLIYKANGGSIFKARGTDTIPAMLSPDEYVVNAASAKTNHDILEKINSAKGPIYRAGGGPVSRVTGTSGEVRFSDEQAKSIENVLSQAIAKGFEKLNKQNESKLSVGIAISVDGTNQKGKDIQLKNQQQAEKLQAVLPNFVGPRDLKRKPGIPVNEIERVNDRNEKLEDVARIQKLIKAPRAKPKFNQEEVDRILNGEVVQPSDKTPEQIRQDRIAEFTKPRKSKLTDEQRAKFGAGREQKLTDKQIEQFATVPSRPKTLEEIEKRKNDRAILRAQEALINPPEERVKKNVDRGIPFLNPLEQKAQDNLEAAKRIQNIPSLARQQSTTTKIQEINKRKQQRFQSDGLTPKARKEKVLQDKIGVKKQRIQDRQSNRDIRIKNRKYDTGIPQFNLNPNQKRVDQQVIDDIRQDTEGFGQGRINKKLLGKEILDVGPGFQNVPPSNAGAAPGAATNAPQAQAQPAFDVGGLAAPVKDFGGFISDFGKHVSSLTDLAGKLTDLKVTLQTDKLTVTVAEKDILTEINKNITLLLKDKINVASKGGPDENGNLS